MEQLLEALARGLCEQRGKVRVRASGGDGELHLELKVAASDRGRVIGKNGRTADALRTVLQAAARARGQRVTLEIRA